jgi:phage protein D
MTAVPAFTPARPALSINGAAQPDLGADLQTLVIEETAAGLVRCRARFLNWGPQNGGAGFIHFDSGLLAFGNQLTVEIGEGRMQDQVFEGRISAVEGLYPDGEPPAIVVYAEDRLEALRQARRTRKFEGVRCAEVIDEIAGDHGLQVQANLGGDDSVQGVIVQMDETDLAFLRRLARRVQADVWLEGDTLMVQPRGATGEEITLAWGGGLTAFRVRADLADQVTELGVAGWDPAGKTSIEEIATDTVVADEVGDGLTGGTIFQAAFGDREIWLGREVPLAHTEAHALAAARYAARARRFVTGTGTTAGDARLRVGVAVDLQGLGAWFDGMYSLVAVRHTFDLQRGLVTKFSVERPFVPEAAVRAYGKGKRSPKKTRPQRKPAQPGQKRPNLAETRVHKVLKRPRKGSDPGKTEQMDVSGEER